MGVRLGDFCISILMHLSIFIIIIVLFFPSQNLSAADLGDHSSDLDETSHGDRYQCLVVQECLGIFKMAAVAMETEKRREN